MTVLMDPEGLEIAALRQLVDFTGRRVLEIGCGDGRLTHRYAGLAAHVTAIDPDPEEIASANADLPHRLRLQVDFLKTGLQEFTPDEAAEGFDIALLSWSL